METRVVGEIFEFAKCSQNLISIEFANGEIEGFIRILGGQRTVKHLVDCESRGKFVGTFIKLTKKSPLRQKVDFAPMERRRSARSAHVAQSGPHNHERLTVPYASIRATLESHQATTPASVLRIALVASSLSKTASSINQRNSSTGNLSERSFSIQSRVVARILQSLSKPRECVPAIRLNRHL